MFEVKLERLEYIRDVPVELTLKAVECNCLRRGSVVGFSVSPVGGFVGKSMLEIKLTDDEQAKYLVPGTILPLEGEGTVFKFARGWLEYLLNRDSDCVAGEKADSGRIHRRLLTSHF
jgi:hypothetical protein